MKKRYDEELAKSAFTKFLNAQPERYSIIWEAVPRKFEPPDYYVFIEGKRYAVEITAIFDQIELNGIEYPSIKISDSLHRFVNDIEEIAKSTGILAGEYAVGLSPLSNFPGSREELLLKLLEYIQRTRNMANAKAEVIKLGYEDVVIQKIDNRENYVEEIISYTPKWKSESLKELNSTLSLTLQVKASKLSNICDPIILLILDAFNYLGGKDWLDIIHQLEPISEFHTICRVSTKGEAYVLKSNEKSWEI